VGTRILAGDEDFEAGVSGATTPACGKRRGWESNPRVTLTATAGLQDGRIWLEEMRIRGCVTAGMTVAAEASPAAPASQAENGDFRRRCSRFRLGTSSLRLHDPQLGKQSQLVVVGVVGDDLAALGA
jgi:hypothetical protein